MKSIVKLTLILTALVLLAGCKNTDSENGGKRLVSAIGFDGSNEEITVFVETVGAEGEGKVSSKLFSEKSLDVAAAVTEIKSKSPDSLGFGQLATVVFGKGLEQKQRESIFDFLKSKSEIPLSARAVSAESAEELLGYESDDGKAIGYGIKKLLERTEETLGIAAHTALYEIEAARLQDMNIYSLPIIGEESGLSFKGMDLFYDDDGIKTLNYRESLAYTVIRNVFEGGELIGENGVYSLRSAKTDIEADLTGGRLRLTVKIKSEPENSELLSAVRDILLSADRDIFGIGEVIQRKNPKLWESIQSAYDTYYKNAEIVVVGV